MELQLALDFVTSEAAFDILHEVGNDIDIVEIGTPFVIDEGIGIIRKIRKAFPSLKILADLKIMDAGNHETNSAIDAGADIVTVLGVANNATIKASIEAARKRGKRIMVDLIDVPDIEKRAAELDSMHVDYLCVHTAFDVQATGKNPLEELQKVKRIARHASTAVAGGITLNTVQAIAAERPDILIVGGGITGQTDKRAAAKELRKYMDA